MNNSWPFEFNTGGYLMALSLVKPGDVNRFFKFSDEVAADLAANPVSADELKRAVEPQMQLLERASSGNTFWLSQFKGATRDPLKFQAISRLFKDYEEVTPARLQQLAKRYLVKGKAWKYVVEPKAKDKQMSGVKGAEGKRTAGKALAN
jgi:zinc protease